MQLLKDIAIYRARTFAEYVHNTVLLLAKRCWRVLKTSPNNCTSHSGVNKVAIVIYLPLNSTVNTANVTLNEILVNTVTVMII